MTNRRRQAANGHVSVLIRLIEGLIELAEIAEDLVRGVLADHRDEKTISLLAIAVYRREPRARVRPLPPYPEPELRPTPSLVLGERHYATTPGPAARPEWLTVPQRGLYTGVMVLGAVGTGKTSACMYPYVDQLLRWRADDSARKCSGLVLEVKGDFCGQVRSILRRAGREDDYVEISEERAIEIIEGWVASGRISRWPDEPRRPST